MYGGGASPHEGETSEAARLRRQLEDMQRSFEEANAARDSKVRKQLPLVVMYASRF